MRFLRKKKDMDMCDSRRLIVTSFWECWSKEIPWVSFVPIRVGLGCTFSSCVG